MALPLPPSSESSPGGLFGIGLRVEAHPPHGVQKISNVLRPDGKRVTEVAVGDQLLMVDGTPLKGYGIIFTFLIHMQLQCPAQKCRPVVDTPLSTYHLLISH
jgi:hypothetical protein